MSLPGYSPDLMPVEALWHWLREDVTYHHCHASAEDLTRRAADFEARINQDPCALADRLWVKDCLDPEEEKLRFSNETWFKTMIFGAAALVSYISRIMTLLPGDIITTGTPPGVGMGKKPAPIYLKPGDVMTLGIEKLGTQRQSVHAWSRA